MRSGWILAESQPAGQEVITAEDISSQEKSTSQSTTQQATDPNYAMPVRNPKPQLHSMILLILMFGILYIVMFRTPKKKQQEQQRMIQSLKKNDRVQTIGGILGTVIEVNDNEVTLKIDESNNTKMKVTATSISRVVG
ncbi:MAG: preprotein translocase subunit YajC [Sedimentisphaerales bacterium]|nr:preprotein translocase subunit YajC [Sedimentisphaerales bacterium]